MSPLREHIQNDFTDSTWFSKNEGQLLVDVIETPREIVVRSAIAGVNAEDIDITLTEDTLTVRGKRHHDTQTSKHDLVHAAECHWGAFSRSIILPSHVDTNSVDAILKKGILTIRIKKVVMDHEIPVLDLDEF
jgi:HSP20 family protein